MTPIHCPTCRRPLADSPAGDVTCVDCGGKYPVLGSIPVLVRNPELYLARSLVAVSSAIRGATAALSEVERVRRSKASAFRRDLMGRIASGLELNLGLLRQQEKTLRGRSRSVALALARGEILYNRIVQKIAQLTGASLSPSFRDSPRWNIGYQFDNALYNLWSDWAGTPAGERQITTIQRLVSASIRSYCAHGGRAVYLGAGLGRYAFEGAKHFSSVVATELSFATAALFMAIRAAPVDFCMVHWGAVSERELVEMHRAVFPTEDYGTNVDYVIADARALPIPDASLEAVVSIFFTDVIPLSKLLPEVRRVLRPGGRFISVGPLAYHFTDRAEWLTQEEIRFVFESIHEMAFESGDTMLEVPFMDCLGNRRIIHRVWSFVATRR
jgi:SAM-dependent methyltransferase